jgi:hypothetical protein
MATDLQVASKLAKRAEDILAPFSGGRAVDGPILVGENPWADMFDRLSRTWESAKDLFRSAKDKVGRAKDDAIAAARAAARAIADAAKRGVAGAKDATGGLAEKFADLAKKAGEMAMKAAIWHIVALALIAYILSKGSRALS